jgi:hypothetical protein
MEILGVMAIIILLIGLLIPAVLAVKRHAVRTRARHEVQGLKEAWLSCQLKQHAFPPSITMMDSNAVAILRDANPQGIPYLDFRSGTPFYCDPWGIPGTTVGVYRVALDEDNDNQVKVGPFTLSASVAVWSAGPDRIDFTSDDVASWK